MHLGSPAADALHHRERLDHALVGEPAEAAERQAVAHVRGQVAQVANLLARKAECPQLGVARLDELLGPPRPAETVRDPLAI